MNRHDPRLPVGGEAKLKYLDADLQIIRPGAFVRCAVTGKPIALDALRYWNVDLQEAYASPEAVMERLRSLGRVP